MKLAYQIADDAPVARRKNVFLTIKEHRDVVSKISLLGDNSLLISAGYDGKILFYDFNKIMKYFLLVVDSQKLPQLRYCKAR